MTAVVVDKRRMIRTMADVLGVEPAALSDRSTPATVAQWDSLNHLNLVMALESEFEVSLSPDEVLAMRDVAAIYRILAASRVNTEEPISLVDCRHEHLPELKAFLARSYKPDYILAVNDSFFRWQFGRTPLSQGNDIHLRLAIVGGQIAGCLGYIPADINLLGRLFRGAWLTNWMVDPEQHVLGLGPLLVHDVSQGFDVVLASGVSTNAREMFHRMGWTDFGLLSRYVLVTNVEGARSLAEGGELDWPRPARSHPPPGDNDVEFRKVDRFDESATQLWDRLFTADSLIAGTRRTAAYLNWRYAEHPEFTYHLVQARRRREIVGLAAYRVEQARGLPVRVGRIVELVAEPDAASALLGQLLEQLRSHEVVAVDFFCPSRRLSEVFLEHGFLPGEHEAARQIPILYQPIDRRRIGIPFMADLTRVGSETAACDWYVTKSDGDQDRPN